MLSAAWPWLLTIGLLFSVYLYAVCGDEEGN